jgi:hypothetical protein
MFATRLSHSDRPALARSTSVLLGLLAVVVAVIVIVVGPAVWSKKARREAALAVLSYLLRRSG